MEEIALHVRVTIIVCFAIESQESVTAPQKALLDIIARSVTNKIITSAILKKKAVLVFIT